MFLDLTGFVLPAAVAVSACLQLGKHASAVHLACFDLVMRVAVGCVLGLALLSRTEAACIRRCGTACCTEDEWCEQAVAGQDDVLQQPSCISLADESSRHLAEEEAAERQPRPRGIEWDEHINTYWEKDDPQVAPLQDKLLAVAVLGVALGGTARHLHRCSVTRACVLSMTPGESHSRY